jgi:hypothetical protein
MILKLFEAQLIRLATAIARSRRTQAEDEHGTLTGLTTTLEASVLDLFVAAGLRPEAAEIVAKAYALGWTDGVHRGTGETLTDAVLERHYAHVGEAARLQSAPRMLN